MRILVVNAGTSSLKLSVIGPEDTTVAAVELGPPDKASADPVVAFAGSAGGVDAVVHRLVHGGTQFRGPVVVDDLVRSRLDDVVELAPLHMPPALALLDSLRRALPGIHVACFDTGFHASLSEVAFSYALPAAWRALGVRRYGFHGLSCAWSLGRAAALLERPAHDLHLVVAHLGSGASVTAIRDGASVDTSMGFTPLEGLVMATRSGSVDPGALTWLQTARGFDVAALDDSLERRSGLLALAGTADMREVERRRAAGDAAALLAFEIYAHRARACIASVAASLTRLDALVFTGGVGEHSHAVRGAVCAGLAVLRLPGTPRERGAEVDCALSRPGEAPAVLVVAAREDLQMAAEARSLLEPAQRRP